MADMQVEKAVQSMSQFQFKEYNSKWWSSGEELLGMEDVVGLGLGAIGSDSVVRH